MRKVILSAIDIYKSVKFIFPVQCKFTPSCSDYAKEAFLTYSLYKAIKLVLKRLLRCHPFSPGGVDFLN